MQLIFFTATNFFLIEAANGGEPDSHGGEPDSHGGEPDRHVVMQLIFFTATNFFLIEAANERQIPPLTDRKEGGKPAILPGSVLLWASI